MKQMKSWDLLFFIVVYVYYSICSATTMILALKMLKFFSYYYYCNLVLENGITKGHNFFYCLFEQWKFVFYDMRFQQGKSRGGD